MMTLLLSFYLNVIFFLPIEKGYSKKKTATLPTRFGSLHPSSKEVQKC